MKVLDRYILRAFFTNFFIALLVMIGMGFWFNAIQRVGPLMSSNTGAQQAFARFKWYSNAMAICGVLVLMLTAFAQVE